MINLLWWISFPSWSTSAYLNCIMSGVYKNMNRTRPIPPANDFFRPSFQLDVSFRSIVPSYFTSMSSLICFNASHQRNLRLNPLHFHALEWKLVPLVVSSTTASDKTTWRSTLSETVTVRVVVAWLRFSPFLYRITTAGSCFGIDSTGSWIIFTN